MTSKHAIVTYATHLSVSTSGQLEFIKKGIESQLPLRNLHWKSQSRGVLRTIQELDACLVPVESVRDELSTQIPVSLLERPLLNIYVVGCEDTDVELYRTTIKKQVKDWYSSVSHRRNQEWLILHVVRQSDQKAAGGKLFQLKGMVIDKLRTDFNSDKRDRCVQIQLPWTATHDNPSTWAEFMNKAKDGILHAFDDAVSFREDEIRRSESQREMPGWNFCTFFILKESLALSFNDVHLHQEALSQYDELEELFHAILKDEKTLSWYGVLFDPAPKDDSAPLLSVAKKPYRDLILANTISVFDLRIYLLACQCRLRVKMGNFSSICRKVGAFLSAFGRRLRGLDVVMPKFFIESWIYTSSLDVVREAETWKNSKQLEGNDLALFHAGQGELTELARSQLDIIGVSCDHLPKRPPFALALPSEDLRAKSSDGTISNVELAATTTNADAFCELYVGTTNKAIDLYVKAGRRKVALKLHGSLAALDMHRGRLQQALTTYNSLPAHYAHHTWTSLESLMLSQALDAHTAAEKIRDREWINILLSYLKTCVVVSDALLLLHNEDREAYLVQLIDGLKMTSEALETDMTYPDHPMVRIQVSKEAQLAEDQDGTYLDVTAQNSLTCPLPFDTMLVFLVGGNAQRLCYELPVKSIPPGNSTHRLFCSAPSWGTFVLDSVELRMSHLTLTSTFKRPNSQGPGIPGTLVKLPRDLQSLRVAVELPEIVELSKTRSIRLVVYSGRNNISRTNIKLSISSATTHFNKATVESGTGKLEALDDYIVVKGIEKEGECVVSIPHSDISALNTMRISVDGEYTTEDQPSLSRTFHHTQTLDTGLPITFNVEDFFRGSKLFCKFTISSISQEHVRIKDVQLGPADDSSNSNYVITNSAAQRSSIITITPAHPGSFLFCVDSSSPVDDTLVLRIRYRKLREEVHAVIRDATEIILEEYPAIKKHRHTISDALLTTLETNTSWVGVYELSGRLKVTGNVDVNNELREPVARLVEILSTWDHKIRKELVWREIRIPVDMPNRNIIAAAKITLLPRPGHQQTRMYAGQPVQAKLSIHTSFHWSLHRRETDQGYLMQFDVEEMLHDWLLSGQKRGDFVAKDDETFTTSVTLIALHHGELSLPKVYVTALPIAGEMSMGSVAIPSTDSYQVHGAEKVTVLPRGGRSTFLLSLN